MSNKILVNNISINDNNCVMIIVGRVLIKFDNENDGDADDVDGCVRVRVG